MSIEIPADEVVVAMLEQLGDGASARDLCEALVDAGHPLGKSQMAIQRTAERGKIAINPEDLSLSVVRAVELAAA